MDTLIDSSIQGEIREAVDTYAVYSDEACTKYKARMR
jgi:hypothetical protein